MRSVLINNWIYHSIICLMTFILLSCWRRETSSTFDFFEFKTLTIDNLGTEFTPDTTRSIACQLKASMGGSTSIRNVSADSLEWKSNGYFQRNRDLGQVFYVAEKADLQSIILRTGPTNKAVLHGAQGKEVFVQFFEVDGTPEINDNGTLSGSNAKHGFSSVHRCDDFIEGVTYSPMKKIYSGVFPEIESTYPPDQATSDSSCRLVYMRWKLSEPLSLEEGKRYAFIIGFTQPGIGHSFTLANTNMASIDAPPSLIDEHDLYPAGWAIRREGDGTLPPIMYERQDPPVDMRTRQRMIDQSLFKSGINRYHLTPTTDGYPDVDTYRDLEFVLEK